MVGATASEWMLNSDKINVIFTFVRESVGKDAPRKNPKTTPTKVVSISLIMLFAFPTCPL